MFKAPEDLPNSLPEEPQNVRGTRQLAEEWENVTRINDLRWEMKEGEKVCEYFILHTENDRGFVVNWSGGGWDVSERYNMSEEIIEIPCTEDRIKRFIDSNTGSGDEYYVYVLACELPDKETAVERAKELYPPKTKEEVREFFRKNNTEDWGDKRHMEKKNILKRESGFNPPSWFDNALKAESAYYVGYTDDLNKRIRSHLQEVEADGAHFTEVFPPTHLVEVYGYGTDQTAQEWESKIGSEILNYPDIVAYWF